MMKDRYLRKAKLAIDFWLNSMNEDDPQRVYAFYQKKKWHLFDSEESNTAILIMSSKNLVKYMARYHYFDPKNPVFISRNERMQAYKELVN